MALEQGFERVYLPWLYLEIFHSIIRDDYVVNGI